MNELLTFAPPPFFLFLLMFAPKVLCNLGPGHGQSGDYMPKIYSVVHRIWWLAGIDKTSTGQASV